MTTVERSPAVWTDGNKMVPSSTRRFLRFLSALDLSIREKCYRGPNSTKLCSRLSFRFDVFYNKHLFLSSIPHINNFIQTVVGFVMNCFWIQLKLLPILVGTKLRWDGHDGGLWLGFRNVYLSWLLQIFLGDFENYAVKNRLNNKIVCATHCSYCNLIK